MTQPSAGSEESVIFSNHIMLSNPAFREFLLARSIFEVACFLSILQKDMESFERHFMQLKPLYLDFSYVIVFDEFPYSLFIFEGIFCPPLPRKVCW